MEPHIDSQNPNINNYSSPVNLVRDAKEAVTKKILAVLLSCAGWKFSSDYKPKVYTASKENIVNQNKPEVPHIENPVLRGNLQGSTTTPKIVHAARKPVEKLEVPVEFLISEIIDLKKEVEHFDQSTRDDVLYNIRDPRKLHAFLKKGEELLQMGQNILAQNKSVQLTTELRLIKEGIGRVKNKLN